MEYLGVTFIPLDETKLTPQELADFEAHYGQRIPDTLRELFQQTNNALVENCVLDIPALEGGVMPEGWAGVGEYGMTYRIESAGSFLPPGMLPFADDPGGSLFAVKMDGQPGFSFSTMKRWTRTGISCPTGWRTPSRSCWR